MLSKSINFVYIILVFLLSSTVYSGSWHIMIVDSDGDVGGNTSLELDSYGYPHISYDDYTNHYLKYAKWTGSKWEFYNINVIGIYDSLDSSLALDANNNPYLSYSTANSLQYAKWNGSSFDIDIIDNSDRGYDYSSLALDSNGYPHISYHSWKDDGLKYAKWTGSEWKVELVDDNDVGYYTSIAIDSNNYPHISYYAVDNTNLKYAKWNGTNWEISIVDSYGDVGCYSSIALDKYDYPHISYGDSTDGYLKYAKWTGSEWQIEKVDSGLFFGLDSSIALDKNGYPHISYIDEPKSCLKYARWTGTKWYIEVIDSKVPDPKDTSIELDNNDNPFISYYDSINKNLKLAWYETYPGIDLTSFTAKPHNDAITLNWTISTDEDISGFNLYRRVASPTLYTLPTVGENATFPLQKGDNTQWTKVNTSLITGTNPYSFTDKDIMPNTNYEYKLEAVAQDNSETLGTTSATSCNGTPSSFEIARIYPTPALSQINIDVVIPEQADIDIAIYDITGRKVAIVASGLYNTGEYTLTSDITGLTDGVFIVKMTSESLCASKRFVVAK